VPKRKAFLLRMSPDLWEEISMWAADELRSVNGQIEFLLRQAVRRRRSGERGDITRAGQPLPRRGERSKRTGRSESEG
jgi:hypothetical protein